MDLEPHVVWGVVVRGLGALFVLAHASLLPQIVAIAGAHGLSPVVDRLAATKRAFPGPRRFIDWPTLLWLHPSDRALRAIGVAGILGGLAAIYGGPVGSVGLVVAWLTYLSLADAAGLTFPWDVFLLEAGFLGALFLPAAAPLVGESGVTLAAVALPSAMAAFSFHWLIARLMLGFAKVKFIGTGPGDDLYLKSFFVWLPVPNPIGWQLAHAPAWFHRLSLRFMFVAEVIAPILVLFPGVPRLIGGALLVALMLGIHASGNWGFFNVAYVVLCVSFLDVHTSAAQVFTDARGVSAADVVLMAHFAMTVLLLALFNTWVSRGWPFWPIVDAISRAAPPFRLLFGVFQLASPFRIANAYGVFPPRSLPPIRLTVRFEGSDDGVTWRRYPFRWLPADTHDAPPVVAPHHPRIDQGLQYAANGFSDVSLFNGLIGTGQPLLTYVRTSSLERTVQRLLMREPEALGIFKSDPFAGRAPKLARVSVVALGVTSLEEKARTGAWWKVTRVGALVPATALDGDVMREVVAHPELMHPDAIWWKRRAPALQAVERAWRSGAALDDALIAESDLTAAHVERFWSEYVPLVRARVDADDGKHEVTPLRRANGEALSLDERIAGERLLERCAWLLRIALAPHRPRRMPNFRFHMAACVAVLDGKDAVTALLKTPYDVVTGSPKARHVALLATLRPSAVAATGLAIRWAIGGELQDTRRLPSILEYADELAARVPVDEEWRPKTVKDERGEWRIEWPG